MRRVLVVSSRNKVQPTHTLSVSGVSEYTGKYFMLQALYDSSVAPATWSVIAGNTYVSVNQNGRVDISAGASNNTVIIRASYGGLQCDKTVTVSYDNQLVIECADTITGTSGNTIARYNSVVVTPTWSVTSGGTYASIDSSGAITISSSGSVTIQASYSGYTVTKTISVVYDAGSTTETVVDPVSGDTTTTTTTTETDPVSGETTTTTTTTTVNDDGSSSETQSETVTQADGSSETTSTTVNSDGTSSETTSATTAPDINGTTQTVATTTNSDGTSSEYTATNNSDGSFNSSTTNYDENGDPTTGSNVEGDSDGNVSTQGIEYDENGDEIVTGYEIDTSGSQSGIKTFNEEGVNTEFYAFDVTRGFVLSIHFTIDFTKQPPGQNENHHNILTMKRATPEPWYGFQLRHSNKVMNIILGAQFSTGSNTNTTIAPNWITTNVLGEYNIQIIYNPNAASNNFVCNNLINGTTVYTSSKLFPDIPELRYLKVCIGCAMDANGHPYRYSNIDVMDFSLEKLPAGDWQN